MLLGEKLIAFRDSSGPRRHHGSSLPAPLRLAVLRPQRRRRHPLRLSRLEVRRRRQLPRHAERAGRPALHRPGQGQGLQGGRARRHDLGLHGQARRCRRRCRTSRSSACPSDERIVHVPPARLQLAAVARRRHRHLALRLPACRRREARRRRCQDHAPLGPGRPRAALPRQGDRLGHDVRGLSPGRSWQPVPSLRALHVPVLRDGAGRHLQQHDPGDAVGAVGRQPHHDPTSLPGRSASRRCAR